MSAPRKSRQKINGWVIIDKPAGVNSTAVVGAVRRGFNAAKAGHGGTLDPAASGILPIALGEATKTIPYIMDASKDYAFTVKWGEETDTDDAEGAVIRIAEGRPDAAAIEAALPQFRGRIMQTPPVYSAIKQGGKRAYDMARAGEAVVLAPREVDIHGLELVESRGEAADFTATTGKGVYIRALGRDIARALGTAGHITALRRLRVGKFSPDMSISLDFLRGEGHSAAADDAARLQSALHPVMTALDDIPACAVTTEDAIRLKRGQKIALTCDDGMVVAVDAANNPVAIIEVAHGYAAPRRVFNMD